jgi:predicted MPP superfamily phosphohydrolase
MNVISRRQFVATVFASAGAAALSRVVSAQESDISTALKPIKIAFITDTHSTSGLRVEQPKHKARFEQVIAAVNAANPDWILHGGDLTENSMPEEISDFQDRIKGLQAPIDWVFGNHDVGDKRVKGQESGLNMERVERIESVTFSDRKGRRKSHALLSPTPAFTTLLQHYSIGGWTSREFRTTTRKTASRLDRNRTYSTRQNKFDVSLCLEKFR